MKTKSLIYFYTIIALICLYICGGCNNKKIDIVFDDLDPAIDSTIGAIDTTSAPAALATGQAQK